ncbi:MAG TPA: A/G-specific adenine glycosylase [Candidatus Angelobacter sp.]|nr:A/G-specific adenine glycosylase [Candidatus Angelobacter sp.]
MPVHARFSTQQVRAFRKRLLRWFDREQRKLPWRSEKDPYRILVSEIMLQQTRVAVVEERYKRFLRQFPTVQELARAREQTVLAAWSGLGYYRRARALHAAAKQVASEGKFPKQTSTLMDLPGVGRYTAAAVASIAFGEPVPVVDGNVKRVLERISGRRLSEQENWRIAGELLEPGRPGDFNQAMMELGAVVCVPGEPRCHRCPVLMLCAARGVVAARTTVRRRKALLRYIFAAKDGRVLLQQRPRDASLMAGMWELPEVAGPLSGMQPIAELRHSITTTDYKVLVYAASDVCREGKWVALNKVDRMALTGLAKKILRQIGSSVSS